jgi:phosphonate transport system permease protein
MSRLPERYRGHALWTLLLIVLVGSVWVTGFSLEALSLWNVWIILGDMFPPDWSVLPSVLAAMAETIGIAFLGTFFAFLLAFPISFLTVRGLGPPVLGTFLRWLMAVMRSIPEILWAFLFVVAIDFGNVAGILALAAHNVGILSKLTAEVFEAAPLGPQEAIASTGSGKGHVLWFGVLPSALPAVLSHTFFRFECSIRTASLLGVVGAGGIGAELILHQKLFQYDAMLVDTLGIVALVILADWLGAYVRKQVT